MANIITRAWTSIIVLSLFFGGPIAAQNITVNNDLVYGDILPGIPKTVDKKTAGSAAEFHVSGTAGSEITIDFTLPTYMNMTGFNMQMIFTKTDCALDTRAIPNQSSPERDNLDPWHTITDRLGSAGMLIWLGGTVVPKVIQPPGDYSASIVLTVAYTGS
jgi:hypothetical protein